MPAPSRPKTRPTASQHKQQREERRSKELVDLKRENNKLRKALSRVRKQRDEIENLIPDDEPTAASPPEKKFLCPVCRSADVAEIVIPSGKIVRGCRSCNWRS